ncbi:hypothetical protein ABZ682_19225 [Streptomyces griseoviridis]|uniref:hypothetical protein n=1 Tax=Streptomyces griseoviridis TaxID=45398 RepID=UPI0033D368EC
MTNHPARIAQYDRSFLPHRDDHDEQHEIVTSLHTAQWPDSTVRLQPRDIAAVNSMVWARHPRPDRYGTYDTLCVAVACGRVQLPTGHQYTRTTLLRAGCTALAGEIAARSIRDLLAAEAGDFPLQPLDNVIMDLWPRPQDLWVRRRWRPGHAPMGLHRMVRSWSSDEPPLPRWQTRALLALASPSPSMRTPFLSMARCATESMPHLLRRHADTVDTVHTEIIHDRRAHT